jgi:hypothetical protein
MASAVMIATFPLLSAQKSAIREGLGRDAPGCEAALSEVRKPMRSAQPATRWKNKATPLDEDDHRFLCAFEPERKPFEQMA